jgi:hypothetical protein
LLTSERRYYFVNPWVDVTFAGGLSIAFWIALWLLLPHSGLTPAWAITWSTGLLWVCNWPHFSATCYRLYSSRENTRQYPFTAWLAPVLVAGGVVGSFLSPAVVAPYFVKLFAIWSPYHFSGQTVGVTLIYSRRCGLKYDRTLRLALSAFIYGTFLKGIVYSEVGTGGGEYYGVRYPGLGLPQWTSTAVNTAVGFCLVAFLYLLWEAARAQKVNFNWMILIPPAAQFFWFVLGAKVIAFREFVPFFHCLQYLLVAWAMQLVESSERTPGLKRGFFWKESIRWGLGNVAGGAFLFWLLPRICAFVAGAPLMFSLAILTSAAQIHHFFVDGVIWKLRRATTAQPLMANIPEYTRAVLQRQPEPAPVPVP